MLRQAEADRTVPSEGRAAARVVFRALRGLADEALQELAHLDAEPASAEYRDAYRMARNALKLIAVAPRSVEGQRQLRTFFGVEQ